MKMKISGQALLLNKVTNEPTGKTYLVPLCYRPCFECVFYRSSEAYKQQFDSSLSSR